MTLLYPEPSRRSEYFLSFAYRCSKRAACSLHGRENNTQECDEAAGALEKLGCAISAGHPIGRGTLLLIEKQKPTPKDYPRRFSKIKNNPL